MARSAAPFSRRILLKSLAALGLLGSLVAADASDALSVSLDEARAEFEAGRVVMIDIREPNEHATGVARGARLLPMSQLGQRLPEISTDPKQPVLLICNTQNRSRATYEALRERGWTNLRFVNGGMSEWSRRAWPMSKPAR